MPIYGLRVQKEENGIPFENRYFTNLVNMDAAESHGGKLVVFEKSIFGAQVEFTKLNVWQIGASPRKHRSTILSGFGSVAGADPTALEMTLKVIFGAEDSYPYYKEYRVCVNAANTNTRTWFAPYLAIVQDAMEAADDLDVWTDNTTKAGVALADPVIQTRVEFSQLHKRWYNRTS